MPDFTKEDLLQELATIFLYEADHITLGAGSAAAEHFIGFEAEDGEYLNTDASRVVLSRFNIAGSFDRAYDYAFHPSLLNSLGEHEVQDLIVFMKGVPRVGGVSSGGETHEFMTANGKCQSVTDAALARWKLEWDTMGAAAHTFTPRELALLANMTEGAVRNAIADKSETGLRSIPGTKNPVLVSHDEAWRWLNSRRGFTPGPQGVAEDRHLLEELRKTETATAFGKLLGQTIAALPAAPSFDGIDIESWKNGSFIFDTEDAKEIATRLQIDLPTFCGKALELSLRRHS